jgi:hypothetical protein
VVRSSAASDVYKRQALRVSASCEAGRFWLGESPGVIK